MKDYLGEANFPRSCAGGCLFFLVGSVVGGALGCYIGGRMDQAAIDRIRARDPDAFIDYLPVMVMMLSVLGTGLGGLLGFVLALNSRKSKEKPVGPPINPDF